MQNVSLVSLPTTTRMALKPTSVSGGVVHETAALYLQIVPRDTEPGSRVILAVADMLI